MSDLTLCRRDLLMSGTALSISAVVGQPHPAAAQKVQTGGTCWSPPTASRAT